MRICCLIVYLKPESARSQEVTRIGRLAPALDHVEQSVEGVRVLDRHVCFHHGAVGGNPRRFRMPAAIVRRRAPSRPSGTRSDCFLRS
jgi:hypothetical protein